MMKTAIVTGAGGFIGNKLTEELSREYKVYAIVYNRQEMERLPASENILPVIGDLNDWEALAEKLHTDHVDLFFHLAWGGISSAAYKDIGVQRDNIAMSISAAMLARAVGCGKFVFAGTNQEYLVSPSAVDGTVCNASVYGICKKSARELCQVLLRDAMAFNATAFTNVFGPGDFSKRTANLFISKLLRGESLDLIEGNNEYDWTLWTMRSRAFLPQGRGERTESSIISGRGSLRHSVRFLRRCGTFSARMHNYALVNIMTRHTQIIPSLILTLYIMILDLSVKRISERAF